MPYHYRTMTTDDITTTGVRSPYITLYNKKATLSGNHIEISKYESIQSRRWVTKSRPRSTTRTPRISSHIVKRADNLARARRNVTRLVHTNLPRQPKTGFTAKFITLTYADQNEGNTVNHLQHMKDLQTFVRKMRDITPFDYVGVSEIQTEREKKFGIPVVHFHLVVFSMPYMTNEDLAEIWGHGFVKTTTIHTGHSNADKATRYICKYLAKDSHQKSGYEKTYFCSQDLKRPFVIVDPDQCQNLLREAFAKGYIIAESAPYKNPFTGNTVIYQTLIPPL